MIDVLLPWKHIAGLYLDYNEDNDSNSMQYGMQNESGTRLKV